MRDAIPLFASKNAQFRLPRALKPTHYSIEIEPDVVTRIITGRVVVNIEVIEATQKIVFHALRLKILRASVQPAPGNATFPEVQYDPEHEVAYIELETTLPARSRVLLGLTYEGEMTELGSMGGLYPTPYTTPKGDLEFGFETMFEPTMARAAFPCFDEPDFKAEFTLSLIVKSDLSCLSNMEIASEAPVHMHSAVSKKKVTFKTSPKMSTYLLVMIAGYFNMVETSAFRVPVRVWAALDKNIDNAKYALEIAIKALNAHEKNFGIEYPLPKLDMVAVPGHQGGMEHWGCVTYQESGLLLNDNPSDTDKLRLTMIVTHELAHQWFGNIVTMKWWDSVWLNESFADWATFHAMSQILPEYDTWADFLASDPNTGPVSGFQEALTLDSNQGSHAIMDPNIPPAAAFDSIAYVKGCSIIRMMAEDIGVELFLKGITRYLKQHMYGNATTEELWHALSEVSGKDVASFMDTWIQTVGYPLLTVFELRPTKQVAVLQSRFLQNGDHDTKEIYPVSIHIKDTNGDKIHFMSSATTTISTSLSAYKINTDTVGFYRVSYPLSRIHKLGVQFDGGLLSEKDKIGLISDLVVVVATGAPGRRARISDVLDFLLSIKDRVTELFVWREILGQLQNLRAAFLFEGEKVLRIFDIVRSILLDQFVKKGFLDFETDDTLEQTMFKSLLLSQLKNHPVAQQKAAKAWNNLLSGDKDALNPSVRRVIFDTVLLTDKTDKTWNDLRSIAFEGAYIRSGDPVTPIEALQALGSTPNLDLIARTLEIVTPSPSTSYLLASTTSMARSRAAPLALQWNQRLGIMRSLRQHPGGAQACWDWLQESWDLLHSIRTNGGINSFGFLPLTLSGLATKEHLKHVEDFFADKVEPSFELLLVQALDLIRARARFAEADRENLPDWAKERGFVV